MLLAVLSFAVMFFPDGESGSRTIFGASGEVSLLGLTVPAGVVPIAAAVAVTLALIYGVKRHRQLPSVHSALVDETVRSGDRSQLIAEARREV